MAWLTNLTRKTLNIGGLQLPPLGMGESNESTEKLRNHLFVKAEWVEVKTSTTTSGVTSKKQQTRKKSDAESE